MLRTIAGLTAAASMLGAVACGSDDAPSRDNLEGGAHGLASQVDSLQQDVRATLDELSAGAVSRDELDGRLDSLKQRANKLSGRVDEGDLPDADGARTDLNEATDGVAKALEELESTPDGDDERSLDRARAALDDAQGAMRSALDELVESSSGDVRDALEELRDSLPREQGS